MVTFLQNFWTILLEISPFVILGMLAAGLIHEILGRSQRLRGFATKRSFLSLSFFNLAGFSLPICSCGVVPLAVGLRKQGVPCGNVFAFIFSAPATSIAAVILSVAVFGSEFTTYYVAGTLLCGYIIGITFYMIERRPAAGDGQGAYYLCDDTDSYSTSGNMVVRVLRWATVTYGSRIAFDLIIGIVLAALLMTTYSIHNVGAWVSNLPYWQAAPIILVLAIPLYVCSIPGIIIGAALVLGQFAPSLLWVFLMAGPVTNLGDITVLRRNLGWRSTLIYIMLVVGVTFCWGWIVKQNVEWATVWDHVREFYFAKGGLPEFSGDVGSVLSEANWLGLPKPVYFVSALIVMVLTLNGARIALAEAFTNPCRTCTHYQQDLGVTPATCRQPCWRSRVVRSLKQHQRRLTARKAMGLADARSYRKE